MAQVPGCRAQDFWSFAVQGASLHGAGPGLPWRRSEKSWGSCTANRPYTQYSGAGTGRKNGPAPLSLPRRDCERPQRPVAKEEEAKKQQNALRRDCGRSQRPVAEGKEAKKQQNALRRDCGRPQRPFAEGKGAKKQQNARRRDCGRSQDPVAEWEPPWRWSRAAVAQVRKKLGVLHRK